MPYVVGSQYEDYEPIPLVQSGPAAGVFTLISNLGDPAPPLLAPSLVTIAASPGKALTLTDSSKVPLGTLIRAFVTFIDADTSPSVINGTNFKTANTAATTITTFDDAQTGQEILLVFTDANTTVAETDNIKLSAAFTSTADDTMRLIFDGTSWFELSRSVN